jgi:hypothetical protein
VQPYCYAHAKKAELEQQCDVKLQSGIIRPSSLAFSVPILLVKKSDVSWRFCIDYRALNENTVKDKFPIPIMEELHDELWGTQFFTMLNLCSGYHQVPMHPDDLSITAFWARQGLFEFLFMPFGLTNVPTVFQALMKEVLRLFLHCFVLVFFDDILIHNKSWFEHLQHDCLVLCVLQEHKFIKRSKCSFGCSVVAYLGHVISADSMATDLQKVRTVLDWPVPESVCAVQAFLGLAGYYLRFIRDYGMIAAPLTKLIQKGGFRWDAKVEEAFRALQHALMMAPVLQLPDFNNDFVVECDASGSEFGAVHQGTGPVVFFSKPIAARHSKLAAYEHELIGLMHVIHHWRPYLWSHSFVIKTDHYSSNFCWTIGYPP